MNYKRAALLCVLISCLTHEPSALFVAWRLIHNAMSSKMPPPVPPRYEACSSDELSRAVTIVVTAKDTCSQTPLTMAHLAQVFPRNMSLVYAYPDFLGCDRSLPDGTLFPRLRIVRLSSNASPMEGFVRATEFVDTPYSLLMHNDVYLMDYEQSVCELLRSLSAKPTTVFAAPQLYERGENGITIPHAHFRYLHRDARNTIAYRLDWDMLTRRRPGDFREHAQPDFLEDHAFLARSQRGSELHYAQFLDQHASFTMEYIDSILNLRASKRDPPWYVPTSRMVFNVDTQRIHYNDLPYFAFKRSEAVGHGVRRYLTSKWNVTFANTGIWNYVRCSYLQRVRLQSTALPPYEDAIMHRALYYTWFQSVGFNRFNGLALHDFLTSDVCSNEDDHVLLERVLTVEHEEPAVHDAHLLVPQQAEGNVLNLSSDVEWMSIYMDSSAMCDPDVCGMLVVQNGVCSCWRYASPCVHGTLGRLGDLLLDALRLPSRALQYTQMMHGRPRHGMRAVCETNQPCRLRVPTLATGRVLQWAWDRPAT